MREPHDGSWAAADQSDNPGAWTEPRQAPVLRSIQQVAALRGTADEWPGHVVDVPGRGVVLDLVRRGGRDGEGHRAKGSSLTGPVAHGAVQRGGRPVVQPTPSAASASVSSPTRASSCTSVDGEPSV